MKKLHEASNALKVLENIVQDKDTNNTNHSEEITRLLQRNVELEQQVYDSNQQRNVLSQKIQILNEELEKKQFQ